MRYRTMEVRRLAWKNRKERLTPRAAPRWGISSVERAPGSAINKTPRT